MPLALVCNYGIVDQTIRNQIEWQGLVKYYQAVEKTLEKENNNNSDNNNKTNIAVFCGGYTNPSLRNLSEAQSAKNYFNQRELLGNFTILTENTSQNSIENLIFGLLTLRPYLMNLTNTKKEILIFCDIPRQLKIKFIVEEIFQKANNTIINNLNYKIIPLQRSDIHKQSTNQQQSQEITKLKENTNLIKIYKNLIESLV